MTREFLPTVDISVILLTFNRPEGLKNALESLVAQKILGKTIEIIVADNDPCASAREIVNIYQASSNLTIHYLHVPEPGVANARNAAVALAKGQCLAFLDDDQIAKSNWLAVLSDQAEKFSAALVFCPTHAQSPLDVIYKSEMLSFFERDIKKQGSLIIDKFFGCGNSFLDLRQCTLPTPPFSVLANNTGGEDDFLFSYLQSQGARTVWTSETHALENIEDYRMTKAYIRKRSFGYGQGPSRICANPDNFDLLGLIRWMVIGAGQLSIYGTLFILTHLFRSSKSIWFMRKASEGAGKLLWFNRLSPKLYGAGWHHLSN